MPFGDLLGIGQLQLNPETQGNMAIASALGSQMQRQPNQGDDILAALTKYAQAAQQLAPTPQAPSMEMPGGWQGLLAAITPGYMEGLQARIAHEQNIYNKRAGDTSAMQRSLFEKAMGLQGEKMKESYGMRKLANQQDFKQELQNMINTAGLNRVREQIEGREKLQTGAQQFKRDVVIPAAQKLKQTPGGGSAAKTTPEQKLWEKAYTQAEKDYWKHDVRAGTEAEEIAQAKIKNRAENIFKTLKSGPDGAPGGSGKPITATGPNGQKLILRDGKWTPM